MSGASDPFSAAALAENQRRQALNLATQRRLLEAQPKNAVKADETALTAEKEARERASVVPARRIAPPASIFAPVQTGAKRREEQDRAIQAAREAVKVRTIQGEGATPTQAEKGEKPKREKREKPIVVSEQAPKPEKSSAHKPEKAPEKPIAMTFDEKVKAFCDAEAAKLLEEQAKRITYTYDLPGAPERLSGNCEPGQFPAIARDLCRNGSRRVTPTGGFVLTLIHCRATKDPVSGRITEHEYSVGRRFVGTEIKGHKAGAKALANGLSRTMTCPECKGMGRIHDNYTTGKDCTKCDGKGTLPGMPIEVHSYHVSSDVMRDGPRGVLAMDRPLVGDPVVPSRKRGAICTGGKPASGVWQSRAKTTRVTFSGG